MFTSSGVRPRAFWRWKITFGIAVQPAAVSSAPHRPPILRSAVVGTALTGDGVVLMAATLWFVDASVGAQRRVRAFPGRHPEGPWRLPVVISVCIAC